MLKLPDVCNYDVHYYVSLSLTNRKSSVHLHALYSPPHCTKDVYTPQGPTRDLWTVWVLCTFLKLQRALNVGIEHQHITMLHRSIFFTIISTTEHDSVQGY
jgi:hypothetical protein